MIPTDHGTSAWRFAEMTVGGSDLYQVTACLYTLLRLKAYDKNFYAPERALVEQTLISGKPTQFDLRLGEVFACKNPSESFPSPSRADSLAEEGKLAVKSGELTRKQKEFLENRLMNPNSSVKTESVALLVACSYLRKEDKSFAVNLCRQQPRTTKSGDPTIWPLIEEAILGSYQ
jgi:hypothetical protein